MITTVNYDTIIVYGNTIMTYDILTELSKIQGLSEDWRLATEEEVEKYEKGP